MIGERDAATSDIRVGSRPKRQEQNFDVICYSNTETASGTISLDERPRNTLTGRAAEESIMDTINFACSCGTDMAVFYLLCPHPGTRVYEIFKEHGLLNMDHLLDPSLSCKDSDFEDIGIKLAGRGAQPKYFTPTQLQGF